MVPRKAVTFSCDIQRLFLTLLEATGGHRRSRCSQGKVTIFCGDGSKKMNHPCSAVHKWADHGCARSCLAARRDAATLETRQGKTQTGLPCVSSGHPPSINGCSPVNLPPSSCGPDSDESPLCALSGRRSAEWGLIQKECRREWHASSVRGARRWA